MQIEKYMRSGVTVVALDGELDSRTAPEVHATITELVPAGGSMLLDLTGVTYTTSAGLRVFLLLYRKARQQHARLALAGLSDQVRSVMAATGFLDAFTVRGTLTDGVEALAA